MRIMDDRVALTLLLCLFTSVGAWARNTLGIRALEVKTPAKGPNCALELEAPSSGPILLHQDELKLQEFSRQHRLVIELIAPNAAALPYSMRPGYLAKPGELKGCKSAPSGPYAGLVQCPPELFPNLESWMATKKSLAGQGFYVLDEQHHHLVVNERGEKYYADYDLFNVVDAQGRPAYTEELRLELNKLLGREIIRHGPLAQYHDRLSVGLKFPILAIPYDGPMRTLRSVPSLQAFERKHKVEWVFD